MYEQLTFDQRDEFNRKNIAENIASLLRSEVNLSPMVIDGGWGKGKTEFCMKLMNLMRESDTEYLIYIDAFKADHADEPLLTILAEVLKLLPDDSQEDFVDKIIPALRFGLKTTAKAAVTHLLQQDSADVVDGYEQEIQKISDKAIDISVESLLKDHVEADKSLAALQTTLKEISQTKRIIIFIDELDRCRPDYAVDLLEVIKHTLDVEGVDFVLITNTNTNQLKASINHCYGVNVDSQRYLDKFLKFTIRLPDSYTINGHHYYRASVAHYKNLIAQSALLQNRKLDIGPALELVERVIHINDVSLREVETLIRHLEIFQILTTQKGFHENLITGYRLLRILGVTIFSLKPDIARTILSNKADAKEIAAFVGVGLLTNFNGDHPYPTVHEAVTAMIAKDCQINSDLLFPQDDVSKAHWEKYIQSYFSNGSYPLERGEKVAIIEEVHAVMSLNKHWQ